MRTAALLLTLLGVACATAPPPADPGPVPKHETYLRNPTQILADSARVILPEVYGSDLSVRGLTAGWRESDGGRVWEGSADCRLELFSLDLQARELTVTLVAGPEDPEVLIQAVGDVRLIHTVGGTSSVAEHLDLLQILNQKRLER